MKICPNTYIQALFAPKIRCAVYDWDRLSGNDLIGRFSISFEDIATMMVESKPRWYHLKDRKGNEMEGKVYCAVEFFDPNMRHSKPIFMIDETTELYYLHLLTIGVRSLRSALGVHKPQILYSSNAAVMASSTKSDNCIIKTSRSSDPSAQDANFLEIQKLPLRISPDYELAPVINIVAQDNMFGNLVKRTVGNTALDLHQFMILRPHSKQNHWYINDDVKTTILNEKYLQNEMAAEKMAELRVFEPVRKVKNLSIFTVQEYAENNTQEFGHFSDRLLETLDKYEARTFSFLIIH